MSDEPIALLQNVVAKTYRSGATAVQVLDGINLQFHAGELVLLERLSESRERIRGSIVARARNPSLASLRPPQKRLPCAPKSPGA